MSIQAEKRGPLPEDKIVGRRIGAVRGWRGMTQKKLGEEIGVSFQQIQKYESGQDRISAGRLVRAARALGVPVSSFYNGLEAKHA
jgi:transcriptional regulator with XRE-family HTH domain